MKSIRPCGGKRQRPTPRSSSCDLLKLHADHKKRAMFQSDKEIYVGIPLVGQLEFKFMDPQDDICDHDGSDDDFDSCSEDEEDVKQVHEMVSSMMEEQDSDRIKVLHESIRLVFTSTKLPSRKITEILAHSLLLIDVHKNSNQPRNSPSKWDQGDKLPEQDIFCPKTSALVEVCIEFCTCAPIDLDLLDTIMHLFQNCDEYVLSRVIDRFVCADPQRAFPAVCNRLVKKWPWHDSHLQALTLLQLESVFKASDEHSVIVMLPPVLGRIQWCISHANFHVANSAMVFAEKIVDFAQQYMNSELHQAVIGLYGKVRECSENHWNQVVKEEAASLLRIMSSLYGLDEKCVA